MDAPREPSLRARVPLGAAVTDPGTILDRFLGWVAERGLEPYPAQEQALLELLDGRHVVLATPTGSGKSLVALGLHFKALCEGRCSFYTAPVKALVSEKFFELCELLGAESVGMLTGDASINPRAPVVCCTTEVLASMALHRGAGLDAPYVVLDEFHYYGDPERGSAWQIPLLELPRTTFLLMSATLGNTAAIEERIRRRTGRAVAAVRSDERPVPLDFDYRETPIQETVEALCGEGRTPVYVVSFTQRACAELGQALTSAKLTGREEKRRIVEAMRDAPFDTPYGREFRRLLSHGVGVHHAGLLPKYRLLVEQLSQRGLLRVICGTDTLGVGVNIPIRTVLFARLSKFDGERVRLLTARELHQIAGRAGRRGFDERGSVVCQAPEHVVENKRQREREARKGTKRKGPRRKAPRRGEVGWSRETFETLVARRPEPLEPVLRISHATLVALLQRDPEQLDRRGGYGALADLVERSHVDARRKRRLRREAAALFRSLRRAEVVEVLREPGRRGARVRVSGELQRDFSLHQTLALYVVEALAALDPAAADYPLDVLSLVEAVLEDPKPVLRAQVRKRKEELLARLKAEGVPYEDRLAKLEEVAPPRPLEGTLRETFALFAERHPWVGGEELRPKSVAREMVEGGSGFGEYVRAYGLQRSEGRLLRYLGDVWSTLQRSVPDAAKSEGVLDVLAYLRTLLARVDASLLREWERRAHPERAAAGEPEGAPEPPPLDLALAPRALAARVRAEMHQLVRALAEEDWEEAARWTRPEPDAPWDAARLEAALRPFLEEHGRVVADASARRADRTVLRRTGPRRWDVQQVLVDPAGENLWGLFGEVELGEEKDPQTPLVRVRRIGT